MAKNIVTLTLSTKTRAALQAEAEAEHMSLERHINQILARRVERPGWPDRAEAAALADEVARVTAERDRARDTAVLHEAAEAALWKAVAAALADGTLVASRAFRAKHGFEIDVKEGVR